MPGRSHRHAPQFLLRHKVLFSALGAAVLVLIGIALGFALLLSGALSTAATTQHSALTHWILDTGLRYSVKESAEKVVVPPLDDPAMIARGLSCYRQHCLRCHGAPGVAPDAASLGMMPVPASLAQAARDWPAAWLYYVTRKGIRMTGMPAWEFRLSEANLWSTVAYLRIMPSLDVAEYRDLSATAPLEACGLGEVAAVAESRAEGDAAVALRQYGCHSCHRIQGVVGPPTDVGPPLVDWRTRKFIAGTLPNTRENLVRWITEPHAVAPQSLMPDLGVPIADARLIADYLLGPRQ
jgi:mono/diheme cytochrome c family protein